jgi:Holliday junction resolvasome RuvABC endonuclease subunit
MSVIGLDLSLSGTGISCGEYTNFTVRGTAADGDDRLVRIEDAIQYYAAQGGEISGPAELAVIEGLPFGNQDRANALVHGAARTALARMHIPYAYVYPKTLKVFATGNADADKPEMVAAAIALGASPRIDHDQADAWWLRRMGIFALAGLLEMPEHQLHSLSVVEWPAPVLPFDAVPPMRKPMTKKCKHGMVCLKNGDHWLHPFNVAVCDKPPTARKTDRTRKEES